MEIEYLENFILFSDTMNFSAAARELFVGQSTLSQRIARMEKELGFDLVQRGAKLKLTTAGEEFRSRSAAIVKLYREAERECAEISHMEAAAVKVPDFRYFLPLSSGFPSNESDLPGKNASIDFIATSEVIEHDELDALRKGFVDVGFTYDLRGCASGDVGGLCDEFELFEFSPEQCEVLIPLSNPLAMKDAVSVHELLPFRFVLTSAPLFARVEAAKLVGLGALGGFPSERFSVLYVGDKMQERFLRMSDENLAISFSRPLRTIGSILDGVARAVPLQEGPLELVPYAVVRKDDVGMPAWSWAKWQAAVSFSDAMA